MTVCVEPGAQWRPGADEDPWEIGPGTPELEAKARLSLHMRLNNAREAPATSRAGEWNRYHGKGRKTIMPVRLTDSCEHGMKNWKAGSCGH